MITDSALTELFENYTDLKLAVGNLSTYKSFRQKEPELMSCLDDFNDEPEPEVLLLERKSVPSNKYAPLDPVIVDSKFRHNGVGRLLLVAGITYLLKNFFWGGGAALLHQLSGRT